MSTYSPTEEFTKRYVKPQAGRTLIVGSFVTDGKTDRRGLYSNVLGVDMRAGPGVDRVLDLEETLPEDLGEFVHVECCSVLEHSRRPWLMAKNIQRLLKHGGTLHLSAPFVWRFHAFPSDYFRFTAEGIRSLFPGIKWVKLMYASNRLRDDHYLNGMDFEEHPHFPRTEILGFGVRG